MRSDPIAAGRLSWVQGPPVDYMQGESRDAGKIWMIPNWDRMSDRKKVAKLREMAELYGGDPHMRWHTAKVLRHYGVDSRQYKKQAEALLAYAQSHLYLNEAGEQLQSPWRTMAEGTGDCDDLALLVCSMAESIRLPWKFALAGRTRQGKPKRWIEGEKLPWSVEWTHIYCVLGAPPFKPTKWWAAEPTLPGAELGYDVTVHGPPAPDQGGGADLGYYGEEAPSTETAIETEPHETVVVLGTDEQNPFAIYKAEGVSGLLRRVPWWSLIISAVEGVITAAAIWYLVTRRVTK